MSRRRRLLIALYPRSWRRRYGEEFLQYLADLDADQPEGKLRRSFNVLLHAVPTHVVYRQATATATAFFLSGALVVVGLYGPGSARSSDPLVWGWRTINNPVIIATSHHTYVASQYAAQEGNRAPVAKIHAISDTGAMVTIECRIHVKCRVGGAR